MDVLHVPFQIVLIADLVLPEPSLPDTFLALGALAGAALRGGAQAAGEAALDPAPSRGEVGIMRRQLP